MYNFRIKLPFKKIIHEPVQVDKEKSRVDSYTFTVSIDLYGWISWSKWRWQCDRRRIVFERRLTPTTGRVVHIFEVQSSFFLTYCPRISLGILAGSGNKEMTVSLLHPSEDFKRAIWHSTYAGTHLEIKSDECTMSRHWITFFASERVEILIYSAQ